MTAPNIQISNNPQTVSGGDMGVVIDGGTAGITMKDGNITTSDNITANSLALTSDGTALTIKFNSYVEADAVDAAGKGTRLRLRPTTNTPTTSTAVMVYNKQDVANSNYGYMVMGSDGGFGIDSFINGTAVLGDTYVANNAIRGFTTQDGDAFLGRNGLMPTTSTTGFAYIPRCEGIPTGVPHNLSRNYLPLVIDSTNSKMYFYNGSTWIALN